MENNERAIISRTGPIGIVKIIADKETQIEESVSNPYLSDKRKFYFSKTKIKSILSNSKKQYHFEKESDVLSLFSNFNKETVFLVIGVQNKRTERKTSAPFITSTLQQDASTKLKFNCKRTMQAAQKLYEAGLITYMRTDSTILSKICIETMQEIYSF